jgi:hypothetical protein
VLTSGAARAAQSPTGCHANDFVMQVQQDPPPPIAPGQTVQYLVSAGNIAPAPNGCDAVNVTITITTADHIVHTVQANANYPFTTAVTPVGGPVSYTANANDAVAGPCGNVQNCPVFPATATATGVLSDNASQDDPFTITKDNSQFVGSYTAMGDSFSSGEGAVPPYIPPTDTPGSNECHRAYTAYPVRVAQYFGYRQANSFNFGACSGAIVADIWGLDGTQLEPGPTPPGGQGNWGEPPQITRVSPSNSLVTLSIGGNDIGFSGLAAACGITYVKRLFRTALVAGARAAAATIIGSVPGGGRLAKFVANQVQKALIAQVIANWPTCSGAGTNFAGMLNILQNGGVEQLTIDGNRVADPQPCPGGVCPPPVEPGTVYTVQAPSLTRLYNKIAEIAPNAQIRVVKYPPLLPPNDTTCDVGVNLRCRSRRPCTTRHCRPFPTRSCSARRSVRTSRCRCRAAW